MDEWVSSVLVDDSDLEALDENETPYGTPAQTIGKIQNQEKFAQIVTGRAQPENMVLKRPGQIVETLPQGFEHMQDVMEMILADQIENNPLFEHSKIEFTYRQNTAQITPNRSVHADPSRTTDAVIEDYVYFASSKQGTLVQAAYVKKPRDTLNKMKPEAIAEEGLMRQAEDFELTRGRASTFHTQGAAVYEAGRTFLRVIITHPDKDYFQALPQEDKARLPIDFREQLGVDATDAQEWLLENS